MRRSGTLGCSLNVGPPGRQKRTNSAVYVGNCTSVAVELRRLFRKRQTAEKSSPFTDEISRNSLGSLISLRSRLFLLLAEETAPLFGLACRFKCSSVPERSVPERSNLPRIAARTAHECYFSPRAALHGAILPRECAAGRTRSVRRAHGAEPALARPSPQNKLRAARPSAGRASRTHAAAMNHRDRRGSPQRVCCVSHRPGGVTLYFNRLESAGGRSFSYNPCDALRVSGPRALAAAADNPPAALKLHPNYAAVPSRGQTG